MTPACTVVVPTRNRRASLARLLAALARQTAVGSFDVVVVLDGSTDDSDRLLATWSGPFDLTVVPLAPSGRAAARNAGAARARARVVLFFDDDVEPEPGVVAAHLRRHGTDDVVVLGDYPIARRPGDSLYRLSVWAWWEDTFQGRAHPEHESSYADFLTGNASVPAALFRDVGCFEERFTGYGAEDYELGFRLLRAGARFVVEPDARALHHHEGTVAASLRTMRQEGQSDVLFAELHPEVVPKLRLSVPAPPATARLLAWRRRVGADVADRAVIGGGVARLGALERLGSRRRWASEFATLRLYAYWQGVHDRLGLDADLRVDAATGPAVVVLDVADGLPDPLPPSLHTTGRHTVAVVAGGLVLGSIVIEVPGSGDVRPYLASELVRQLGPRIWVAARLATDAA